MLYLDRLIQEAELLQAIARVNRTAPKKSYGLVVDYYGVAGQLTQALAAYTSTDGEIDPDVDGALRPLIAEIAKLDPQRERVRQLFVQRGVDPSTDTIEDCILLLEDERLRAEFDVALKQFLDHLRHRAPPPRGAAVRRGASTCSARSRCCTRRRYRDDVDGDFDPHKYKEKVRRLIDQHITVLDLSQKIAPIKITDVEFADTRPRHRRRRAPRRRRWNTPSATTSANTSTKTPPTTTGSPQRRRRDPRPARRPLGTDRPRVRRDHQRDQRRPHRRATTPASTRRPSCRSTA